MPSADVLWQGSRQLYREARRWRWLVWSASVVTVLAVGQGLFFSGSGSTPTVTAQPVAAPSYVSPSVVGTPLASGSGKPVPLPPMPPPVPKITATRDVVAIPQIPGTTPPPHGVSPGYSTTPQPRPLVNR